MGLRVGIETGIEARLTELMGLLTLPPPACANLVIQVGLI